VTLSLLAMALLALKLVASVSRIGLHKCSNLRTTCSDLMLRIRKHLQNLNQPSLDEEVTELAKMKSLKLMDGFFSGLMVFTSLGITGILRKHMVSMLRLDAEATEVFVTTAVLSFILPLLVPCMAFLQFPHMRTDRNISIWMTVIYAQHVVYVISDTWEGYSQTFICVFNLGHVVLALCVWSLGWSLCQF
jgi:hypothetical protein